MAKDYVKTPNTSVQEGFFLPNTDQRGISRGWMTSVDYNEASKYLDSTLEDLAMFGMFPMARIIPGGGYQFGNGSVSAPSISFATDTDTGFYKSAVSQIDVTIDGTRELTFNSSGLQIADMTQGSVLFAGASGQVSQDNSNLFWDDSNNRLGIGCNDPWKALEVRSSSSQLVLSLDDNNAVLFQGNGLALTITGYGTLYGEPIEMSWTGAPVAQSKSISCYHTDNTSGSSHARFIAQVGGSSAGDAATFYSVAFGTTWGVGLDNSDSDSFKISKNATLGTNDYLALDTSGNLYLPTGYTTGSVLFIGSGGQVSQNNSSLFWDNTNSILKVNQAQASTGAIWVSPTIRIYGTGETWGGTQYMLLSSGTPNAGIDIAGAGSPKLTLGGTCKLVFPGSDGDIALGNNNNRWQQVCAQAFNIFLAAGDANPAFQIEQASGFVWGAGGASSGDVALVRDGAGILSQKLLSQAQEYRIFGNTTGTKYFSLKHDGTNAIITQTAGALTLAPTGSSPATGIAALDFALGRNSAGSLAATTGDFALQYGGGGFRHWISTLHDSTSAGSAIRFYVNTSGTSGGSSAPGTGNAIILYLEGDGKIGGMTATPRRALDVLDAGGSPQIRATFTDNSVYAEMWANSAGDNVLTGSSGYVIVGAPSSAITSSHLSNSQLSFSLDEAGNNLLIKVKYSGGTVKTATIPVV